MNEELRAELLEMERVDRAARANLVARGELHATPGYHPEMEAIHRRHNARMRAIIATLGWPGRTLVGEEGCRAAGFVMQHAILDPDLQQQCVDLLAGAVERGEAEGFMLALLTDRVLMAEGKPQIYGTQYVGAEGGGVEPWPIADPDTVDERRAKVDLMPLADNTARLNKQQLQETSAPEPVSLACQIGALDPDDRARRQALADQLHAATQEVRELADGYAFRYPADLLPVAAEFVGLERRCCPFFAFALEIAPDSGPVLLRLTGPDGAKAFIQEELGLGAAG